jgi:hypothetical protein
MRLGDRPGHVREGLLVFATEELGDNRRTEGSLLRRITGQMLAHRLPPAAELICCVTRHALVQNL